MQAANSDDPLSYFQVGGMSYSSRCRECDDTAETHLFTRRVLIWCI